MAHATTISSFLVVGAGILLFGSALAMAAPLDYYERKGRGSGMKRGGRILAFIGALAVFGGSIEELNGQHVAVAGAVLLLLFAALSALLLLPVFGSIEPGHEDERSNTREADKAETITFSVSVHGCINTPGNERGSPQNGGADPQSVTDSQGEPHVE